MSELKAGTIKTPYREGIAFVVDDTFYDKEEGETLFYLKSEADKVIAEKDAKIAELIEKNKRLANKDIIMASETIKDLYKELRHSNYKRCLTMRNMCRYAQYWYSCLMEIESCKISSNNIDFRKYNNKYHFYLRWRKRWLELAKEPTWAKFLQLIHKEVK